VGELGRSGALVAVVLLGELVQSDALGSTVDLDETGDVQLLASLLGGGTPLGDAVFGELFAAGVSRLGDDLPAFVHHQRGLLEATDGVRLSAGPHLAHGSGEGLFGDLLGLFRLSGEALGCHGLGGLADGFACGNLDGHDVLLFEEEGRRRS